MISSSHCPESGGWGAGGGRGVVYVIGSFSLFDHFRHGDREAESCGRVSGALSQGIGGGWGWMKLKETREGAMGPTLGYMWEGAFQENDGVRSRRQSLKVGLSPSKNEVMD